MATTQYIGARYVPLFAEPLDWSIDSVYEALTIVYYAGNSYTSRQAVPKGIDITNEKYWALTGNYNAQIEQYRQEVKAFDGRITENAQKIADEVTRAVAQETDIKELIESEATRAKNAENELATDIESEATRAKNAENELATDIESEATRAKNAEKINSDSIAKLDSEMTGTSDSGLKTLIEENNSSNLEKSMRISNIVPISRVFTMDKTADTSAVRFYGQNGFVHTLSNGNKIVYRYACNPDTSNPQGRLIAANGINIISSFYVNLGHDGSMFTYGNYLYVQRDSSATSDYELVRFSINPNTGSIDSNYTTLYKLPMNSGHLSVSYKYDGYFYQADTANMHRIKISDGSIAESKSYAFNELNGIAYGLSNGTAVWECENDKRYIVHLRSIPNNLQIIDDEGNAIKVINLPISGGLIGVGELESIQIKPNGDCVIHANDGSISDTQTKTCTTFEGNLFDSSENVVPDQMLRKYGQQMFIDLYPNTTDYLIPIIPDKETSLSSTNPIQIHAMQDLSTIMELWPNACFQVSLKESGTFNNGIAVSGGTLTVDLNNYILSHIETSGTRMKLYEAQPHSDDTNLYSKQAKTNCVSGSWVTCDTGTTSTTALRISYGILFTSSQTLYDNVILNGATKVKSA